MNYNSFEKFPHWFCFTRCFICLQTSNPPLSPNSPLQEFKASSSMSPGKIESRFADYQKPHPKRKTSIESQSDVTQKQPTFKQEVERSENKDDRTNAYKVENKEDVETNHKSIENRDNTIPAPTPEEEHCANCADVPEDSDKQPEMFCEAPIAPDAEGPSNKTQSPSATNEKPQIPKKPSALVALRWNKTDETILRKRSLPLVPSVEAEIVEENRIDKSRDNFSDNTLDSSMNDIEASLHRSSSLPKLISSSSASSRENLHVSDDPDVVARGTQAGGYYSEQSTLATKRNEKRGSKGKGVARSFSLMWKTPSREALSRFGIEASAAGVMKSDELNLNLHKKVSLFSFSLY